MALETRLISLNSPNKYPLTFKLNPTSIFCFLESKLIVLVESEYYVINFIPSIVPKKLYMTEAIKQE